VKAVLKANLSTFGGPHHEVAGVSPCILQAKIDRFVNLAIVI
jgi:hypothetical protein